MAEVRESCTDFPCRLDAASVPTIGTPTLTGVKPEGDKTPSVIVITIRGTTP